MIKRRLSFEASLHKIIELVKRKASHNNKLEVINTKACFKKSYMTAQNSNHDGYHGDNPSKLYNRVLFVYTNTCYIYLL
jgi:hypothetical protein